MHVKKEKTEGKKEREKKTEILQFKPAFPVPSNILIVKQM